MLGKLEKLEQKFLELERELSSPGVFNDQERYTQLAKQHSDLGEVVAAFRRYKDVLQELDENRVLAGDQDPEIRELARLELGGLAEEAGVQQVEVRIGGASRTACSRH